MYISGAAPDTVLETAASHNRISKKLNILNKKKKIHRLSITRTSVIRGMYLLSIL